MTITRTDATRSAVRSMSTAYPADVDAWNALDTLTARQLLTAMEAVTAGDSQDVRSHAAVIVAGIYLRAEGHGIERTRVATKTARRKAVRAVKLASIHAGELAAGVDADELEPVLTDAARIPTMPTSVAPPVDGIARTSWADIVATVLAMAGPEVAGLVEAWEAHDADACDRCHGVGARVTLGGILAHIAGDLAPRGSAAHKRLSRQARAVLAMVPGHGIVRTEGEDTARAAWDALAHRIGDPSPMATRPTKPSVAHIASPVTRPAAPVVTVTRPDGTRSTRPMTGAEAELIAAPATGAPEYLAPVDGMPAMGTTPHANDAANGVQARSHKPVVSPRKRAAGSTGPTVTGSTRALGMTADAAPLDAPMTGDADARREAATRRAHDAGDAMAARREAWGTEVDTFAREAAARDAAREAAWKRHAAAHASRVRAARRAE